MSVPDDVNRTVHNVELASGAFRMQSPVRTGVEHDVQFLNVAKHISPSRLPAASHAMKHRDQKVDQLRCGRGCVRHALLAKGYA